MAQDEENGFHGYRYLVDAKDARQYALRFDNGKPLKPIHVFNPAGGFKPNETVFAFDDEVEISAGTRGIRASTVLVQITTDAAGNPRNLKMCGCDYDVKFRLSDNTITVSYALTAESSKKLAEMDFSPVVPGQFTNTLDAEALGMSHHGSVQVPPDLIRTLPFPPHQEGGALTARASIETTPAPATVPAAPASPYSKADDQTLVEVKKLGKGEKMKIIFDFEARRVTEVFDAPGKTAMTGHSFGEHDSEALEKAYERLVDLSGKPKPLDRKKAPSLKRDPK